MSQNIAEFFAKISADTSGLQKGLADAKRGMGDLAAGAGKTGGAVNNLSGKLAGLINPATIATAAFTGLGLYLRNATKAAAESAQIDAKLQAVLKATGNAAGMSAGSLDSLASSLSAMSGVDDEVIKNGEAVMLTFREIGQQVFPEAMQAAMDMSAVMGGDLQGAIMQVSKALNDPIGGVNALRRAGVALTDQQKDQIKVFMESGDIASAQGVILDELSKEFGGAAKAMNDAGDGSQNLATAWGNLSEAVGSGLLPAQRLWNQMLTETITKVTELINISNAHKQAQAEATKVTQSSALEAYHAATGHAYMNEALQATTAQLIRGAAMTDAYDRAYGNLNKTLPEVTQKQFDLNAAMDQLGEYMSGELGEAQDDYNSKIAEYKTQLAEARGEEEKREIEGKIQAETEAYNQRAAAIMFNIQQRAILAAVEADPSKAAEATAVLTELASSYGLIDEAQKNAMNSTGNLVSMWMNGALTEEQLISALQTSTEALQENTGTAGKNASALGNLTSQEYHAGERAKDAALGFEDMGAGAEGMGNSINSSATPAVAGLKSVINGLQDKTVNVDVNIRTHGHLPSVFGGGNRGNNSGPGAGYENNAGVDQEFWTGGQLGKGWSVVGDMPGGAWSPYTELVSPSGFVFSAEESRAIKKAGMLGSGVQALRFGSDTGVGIGSIGGRTTTTTTTPKKKPKHRRRDDGASAPGETGSGTVDTGTDTGTDALGGISNQVAAEIEGSIVSAMTSAQQAATSAAIMNQGVLKDINNNLQALIAKTPGANDISRAVYTAESKQS